MPTSGWDNMHGTRDQRQHSFGGVGDFPVEMDRRHNRVQGSRAMGNHRQFQNRMVFSSEMAESRFGLQVIQPLSLPCSTAATDINKPRGCVPMKLYKNKWWADMAQDQFAENFEWTDMKMREEAKLLKIGSRIKAQKSFGP